MAALSFLADLCSGALDLVFAPVCVACQQPLDTAPPRSLVCGLCWLRCRPLPVPRCPRCWSPLPGDAALAPLCRTCAPWPPALRAVRSAFVMSEVPRRLVHALKYRGWRAAAGPMAERMAAMPFPRETEEEAGLVIAVPTSAARRRERGYNQAELLAGALAARGGRRHASRLLLRTRATATQTALHPGERRANVARAFAVPAGGAAELRGEHVLLVDDVWTTGATVLSCAQALFEAGARVASVATFARVVPELERSLAPAPPPL